MRLESMLINNLLYEKSINTLSSPIFGHLRSARAHPEEWLWLYHWR
jgi:hypothetical protein